MISYCKKIEIYGWLVMSKSLKSKNKKIAKSEYRSLGQCCKYYGFLGNSKRSYRN